MTKKSDLSVTCTSRRLRRQDSFPPQRSGAGWLQRQGMRW